MSCALPQATFLCRVLGISLLSGALGGCGIYQNEGRKAFEDRSSGTLNNNIGISKIRPCWKQSASEPIWPVESHTQIKVQVLENNQLLICAEEAS